MEEDISDCQLVKTLKEQSLELKKEAGGVKAVIDLLTLIEEGMRLQDQK